MKIVLIFDNHIEGKKEKKLLDKLLVIYRKQRDTISVCENVGDEKEQKILDILHNLDK